LKEQERKELELEKEFALNVALIKSLKDDALTATFQLIRNSLAAYQRFNIALVKIHMNEGDEGLAKRKEEFSKSSEDLKMTFTTIVEKFYIRVNELRSQ
jgi:hypothetical protein